MSDTCRVELTRKTDSSGTKHSESINIIADLSNIMVYQKGGIITVYTLLIGWIFNELGSRFKTPYESTLKEY